MPRDHRSPASARPDRLSAPEPAPGGRPPLLSQRAALILFMAVSIGVGVGVLTLFAGNHPAMAVIAGLMASAGSARELHNLID